METNNQEYQEFSEREESGYDFMGWVMLFLRHWYLFVIFTIIAFGAAYMKNRSWIEEYRTNGQMLIDNNKSSGSQFFMSGFGTQSSYKNFENQLIMLTTYDFISRVVDSIPFLNVDYITKGRFKERNIYDTSPIHVTTYFVDNSLVDSKIIRVDILDDKNYDISFDENENEKEEVQFKGKGVFGEPFYNNRFIVTINKTQTFSPKSTIYIKFRSKRSLIGDFASRLSVGYATENSSIINISLTSSSYQRDIEFINKLCDVYLSENLERKNIQANKTINFIDEQLTSVKDSLASSEDAVNAFKRNNRIVDLTTHSANILGKANSYEEQKMQFKLRTDYLNYLEKYLKKNFDDGGIVAPITAGINQPVLISLVENFNLINNTRKQTTVNDPRYAKITRELEDTKSSINEVVKGIKESMDIERLDLNDKMESISKQINALPIKQMELVNLQRKYQLDDNYYTFFLNKRQEATLKKASNTPDNEILSKARVVEITNADTKSKNTITYLLIGLLIPSLFIVLKELMNNTIRGTRDIEKNSDFPIIGTIKLTKKTDALLTSAHPRSSFTELFRVIRTRVEFIVQRKSGITLLTTSTESGDGKTFISTNLAATYGMTDKKTLLVDMDIRKPSVPSRLNLTEKYGVTNYLIGEKELDEVILKKENINFDILLAGTIPPNPGEFIRSEKLKSLFDELKSRYDYIIVDTSPIGLVADAYSLAPMMDVNLFVVKDEKTNKTFFKKITEQIKADKLKNVYIILNGINIESGNKYSYYGGKRYGYGYGYGYGYYGKKNKKKDNKYTHYYDDSSDI